jgi:hypothetical protein
MALHLADAVADAVALVFGDRAQDSKHEFGNAVSAHVTTEVDHVQADAGRLQFLKRAERVGGGSECAVKASGDNHVTGSGRLKQPCTFRALGERRRATDAGFDKEQVSAPRNRRPLGGMRRTSWTPDPVPRWLNTSRDITSTPNASPCRFPVRDASWFRRRFSRCWRKKSNKASVSHVLAAQSIKNWVGQAECDADRRGKGRQGLRYEKRLCWKSKKQGVRPREKQHRSDKEGDTLKIKLDSDGNY